MSPRSHSTGGRQSARSKSAGSTSPRRPPQSDRRRRGRPCSPRRRRRSPGCRPSAPALVARAGHQRTTQIGGPHDVEFGLPYPDRLDQDVVAPNASSSSASRAARGRPPWLPRVARLRMNTPGSRKWACMRMRSPARRRPRTGSTGPPRRRRRGDPRRGSARSTVHQRALAGAWRTGDADGPRASRLRVQRARSDGAAAGDSSSTSEMARASARDVSGSHAIDERGGGHGASRPISGKQLPRDHQPLNLARALADRAEPRVAPVFFGREIIRVAVAAVNLDLILQRPERLFPRRKVLPLPTLAFCFSGIFRFAAPERSKAAQLRSALPCRRT